MTRRWVWFLACSILGLAAVLFALAIPAHLRAVDSAVLKRAGRGTPGLVDHAFKQLRDRQLGPARLLLQAAQSQRLSGREKLEASVNDLAMRYPRLRVWGRPEPVFDAVFRTEQDSAATNRWPGPITAFLLREDHLSAALELLKGSPRADLKLLLGCRSLTNTALLPPSGSSSGQAFDVAVALCGMLQASQNFAMSNQVSVLALQAQQGARTERLEQIFLDLLSLGQRMDWAQLSSFVQDIPDPETLRQLTAIIRSAESRLPIIFSAVSLSGAPVQVTSYLTSFGRTGLPDLADSLSAGAGGVLEMLARNKPLSHPSALGAVALITFPATGDWAADLAFKHARLALAMKCLLYMLGGFFLASAVRVLIPRRPYDVFLRVRGVHFARELLFASGFLVIVLLLSEPFLSQESQKVEFPFRLRLPMVGGVASAAKPIIHTTLMNTSLLTLLLFFVLQALIYTACLLKLAEIRRQNLPPRMKLKLLENEDHLFDAGLYLGFVGTIISLILVSLGVIAPSLMAAYSSTSFGIIFVSAFKIFNLRPLRRSLLLEAESLASQEPERIYAIT